MQAGVGLLVLDMMPIYDHCLEYCHNYLIFYQLPNNNLFTHYMLFSRAKPLVKTMAPGSIFYHISFQSIFICNLLLFNLYHKNTKNIFILSYYFYQISLSQVAVKGLTTPFVALVASSLFVCVGAWDF